MIVTKRNRPTRISDEAYRRIREWKTLRQTAKELGLSDNVAFDIRKGSRYKQVKS